MARYQLGTLLARLKDRSSEDEAAYLDAIAEQEALTRKPTATVEDKRELARYLNNLGILQSGSRREEARATFMKALTIQNEIEAQSAMSAGFRWQRARTWNNLAILDFNSRSFEEADASFTKARRAFESLAADFPKVPDYRRELAVTLNNLGLLLQVRPSDQTKPIDLFNLALEDQRRLVADFPEVPDHKLKLAVTCLHIGNLLRPIDPERGETSFREAIGLQEKLTTDFPEVPEYQAALGRSLTEHALLVAEQNKPADALPFLDRAIPALEKARSGNPRDQSSTRFLVEAHTDKGRSWQGSAARRTRDRSRATGQDCPEKPDGYLRAASFLAKAFDLAGADTALQETYARATIQNLRNAIDKGANDPALLDGPDFKPLKDRPDFQKLRDDWNAKGRKATV